MSAPPVDPHQPLTHVLERLAEEMLGSVRHLEAIEHGLEMVLSSGTARAPLGHVQNIDLVCQTLEDLARLLRHISDVAPAGAQLSTEDIGAHIKLANVRTRLLGMSVAPHAPEHASGYVDLF
ncbi:hypothetical protein [Chachezhania sediminis]|uniref:hypothetical protein n=1 Tax=Chachezhania sediminis TaxID=2599291 RepID=UPI00131E3A88|nr:hypothetical protein [Chachezhania sediminis]